MNWIVAPSLLACLAAIGFASGAAATTMAVDKPANAIATNCRLEGWQYALEPNAQNLVRVELSPTLADDQVQCVYQTLYDYDVPLDRPAPVQVTQHAIMKANGTPQ